MIKRALAAALCLMLAFALLPRTAQAGTPANWLYFDQDVGLTYEKGGPAYTVGKDVTWRVNGRTLTLLGGFDFTTTEACAIKLASGAEIEVVGTNTVTSTYNGDEASYGIYGEGALTFKGTGSLTASAGSGGERSVGIKAGFITVTGGTVRGVGSRTTARQSVSYGVMAKDDYNPGAGHITVTGGTLIGESGESESSFGVWAQMRITAGDDLPGGGNGSIIGTGGKATGVTALTDEARNSYGVYAGEGITANQGGSITGTGKESVEGCSYGVFAKAGGITANQGGSITGTGGLADALSSYGVYVHGGDIVANGGSITGTGGEAKAFSAESCGVSASASEVTVSGGGSVTGVGGQAENPRESISVVAIPLTIEDGRFVGEVPAEGEAFYGNPIIPDPCYWRTGKSGVYTYSAYSHNPDSLYVDIRTAPPPPSIAVSVPTFGAGLAPANETVTVAADVSGFNATNHFERAELDGTQLDLGTVGGAPGVQGSVRDGSIVIRFDKAYLDTLSVGTHTLTVFLKGEYAGQSLRVDLRVVVPTADGEAGAGVPKTGDAATPMLWLGLALLASVGLAVSVARRKRRNG